MIDMMVLEPELGLGKKSIFVINIYNLPINSERTGRSIDILIKVSEV